MSASRWTSLLTPVMLGAVGLVLAACSNDGPTSTASNANAKPRSFAVTSADFQAASMATGMQPKLFETISRLESKLEGQRSKLQANLIQSPYDLTYNGGPVVTSATHWNVYVNCAAGPASCWGTGSLTPKTFLQDYNESSMFEVVGQYLGEIPDGHFGTINELNATVTIPVDSTTGTPTVTQNFLFAILHAASEFTTKSGYNQIYSVFLPQGVDMCMSPGVCYSPDNLNSFVFCAFHDNVNFGPNWHVLYTVQPYQFVNGCAAPNQPRVIDATASTLEHETTETITDPDLDAWFNDLTGNEIMDLCFTFRNPEQIASNVYVVQDIYSNTVHACTDGSF
jgi:hypothetical protein